VRELDLGRLTAASRAGLCWSPDGSQIAFGVDDGAGNIHLYRIPPDAGESVRITLEPGQDLFPDWSPDGRRITYTHLAGGETQIWAVPATGGRARKLTWGEGVNQVPIWAPDSDRFVYLSAFSDGTSTLRVNDLSGEEDREILSAQAYLYPLAWSETGDEVLYRIERESEYTIWALALDGSTKIKVGEGLLSEGSTGIQLTPEGRTYVGSVHPSGFLAYADGDRLSDLYTVKVSHLLRPGVVSRR
jgi:Tol biopolymer transport system component